VNGFATMQSDFARFYEALTGYSPLRWQQRLFGHFARGTIPPVVNLPTGLGKTSVIPIWLIALAQRASEHANERQLPRRLVYIVNRRTVVDQATDMVEQMRERLLRPADEPWGSHADTLRALAHDLRRLAHAGGDELPLAVSTLRGELADNEEWKVNPARPAIIVGTIDMIGSKLLFSGYGDGRYGRAHHAGLIGQDALIVHDEAHLTPAFSALMNAIETEQEREQARNGRPAQVNRLIRVMELSATTRSSGLATVSGECEAFGIEPEDDADSVVQTRLTARKRLSLTSAEPDGLTERIVQAAFEHEGTGCRVLVYVRSPEKALEVQNTIVGTIVVKLRDAGVRMSKEEAQRAARQRVGLLTGTIRGYERDLLAESDLFKAFKADAERPPQLEQTLYLVSTSAGEVGVDLDADHLVCDLTTLDSMIQRFGRVNRLGVDSDGRPRAATITVVVEQTNDRDPLREELKKTAEVLRRLPQAGDAYDASPQALDALLKSGDAQAAFAPSPQVRPVSDILLDNWSLTSITGEMPGRPEVAPYLHGVADWEPPETFVVWRAELAELARADVSNDDLEEVFDAFPIRAAERLRDRTDRVFEELRNVADRLHQEQARAESADEAPRRQPNHGPRVVLIKQNKVQWACLSELVPADKHQKDAAISRLTYAIVVLPVEAGGLRDGMLDGSAPPPDKPSALDVAEATATGQRVRRRVWINADDTEKPLIADGGNAALPCRLRITLADDEEATDGLDGGSRKIAIEYRVEKGEAAEPGVAVTLSDHSSAVEAAAKRIGQALGLPAEICEAVALAARWHDRGKDRPVWQRYARNRSFAGPLAKSEKYGHWRELGGYRHEFGSLWEAAADPEIQNHPERELILHLIAAHHGWARPHFEPQACDNEGPLDPATGQRRRPTTRENEAIAIEAMQRFGRLQLRFGRWGLAWLESLLRCADALASGAPQTPRVANEAAGADSIPPAEKGTPATSGGGATPDAGSEGRL
jgi:CRISPR-associated endonuclease/helicase Cas3